MNIKRIVKQWEGWQLICTEKDEYLLAMHDGFDIDFDAPNDEEAIIESLRLIRDIDGEPTHSQYNK